MRLDWVDVKDLDANPFAARSECIDRSLIITSRRFRNTTSKIIDLGRSIAW
jgi:hypothetical protein